jgi:hypothetical protein
MFVLPAPVGAQTCKYKETSDILKAILHAMNPNIWLIMLYNK